MRQGLLAALVLLATILLIAPLGAAPAAPEERPANGISLTLHGPIGPASAAYIEQELAAAAQAQAGFVLLNIDTPGGLDQAMRDIIKAILASPVPVVSYVSPSGARAASAGTYILYASHVAAMAPATNLGAATPVSIGGSPALPGQSDESEPETDEASRDEAGAPPPAADNASAKRNKVVNDAVAYIRGLAEKRGRNADWAEAAVREGASLSAEQAAEKNVIDLVADSQTALLAEIDGRTVATASGSQTLRTARASLETRDPDWRMRILAVITNPSVAYILMMIGIYGLILEGYSPGALVPGITGAICLVIALFAFQILPVSYAGLALILLGIGLMTAEAFAPSFGILGLGGVVAFVAGSIFLMDTSVPGYEVHLGLIAGIATAAAGLMFLIVWLFARSRRQVVTTGREGLVGSIAEVIESGEDGGRIFVHGESWRAQASRPLTPGEKVRVLASRGLTLEIEPVSSRHAITE
ncbi:MAG: serine protease [Salinisphaeraceae bacterium]|nr:serine protease [Salinisphaeraceae bacterium]